jgi:hypothetical protein
MTSFQAQTYTQHLNSIHGSIYHRLWGDVKSQGGDGADVGDDEDGVEDVMEILPPTPRSCWWQWRWFPSGGSSISTLPEVEKGFRLRCLGRPFFVEMKASIKIQRRDDARGPNELWWRDLEVGRATHALLGLVAPLVCFNLSSCFSWYNNTVNIPDRFYVQKVPETAKYRNNRFFVSRKLNTKVETL